MSDPKSLLATDTSLLIRPCGMIGMVPGQGGACTKLANLQGDNVKLIGRGDRVIAADGTQSVSVGTTAEDKQKMEASSVADSDADATHAYWIEAQNPGRGRRVALPENQGPAPSPGPP